MISLEIEPRSLRRLTLAIGVLNTLLLGAFALIQAGRLVPGLVPIHELDPALQLDMQSEGGTIAVWYSSLVFLLVAAVALLAHTFDRPRRRESGRREIVGQGWLLLALGGVFLSLDESAQIHEGIGYLVGIFNLLRIEGLTGASSQFVWVLVFAPLFLAVSALLVGFFFWLAPVGRARVLALLGIACWATVPALEYVESRLARTFGELGVAPEQLLEESLELIGATALIAATTEYVIGRQSRAMGAQPPEGSRARASSGVAVVLPMLLIPLAGLASAFDDELGAWFADRAYAYSAYRVEMVMFNLDPQGNYLLSSDSCNLEPFARTLPYKVERAGRLVDYPPPAQRTVSPPLTITALELTDGAPATRVEESLWRVALLGTHLWHMRCGDGTEVDRTVEAWLDMHAEAEEEFWLPGLPPITLTRASPIVPPPGAAIAGETPAGAVFGGEEVVLDAARLSTEGDGAAAVLRVALR